MKKTLDNFYSLSNDKGLLRIFLGESDLTEFTNCNFLGIRQKDFSFSTITNFIFTPELNGDSVGIAIIQSNLFYFEFIFTMKENKHYLILYKNENGQKFLIKELEISLYSNMTFKLECQRHNMSLSFGKSLKNLEKFIDHIDTKMLCSDVAGGFVGTCIGILAYNKNKNSKNFADFNYFEYRPSELI